MAKFVIECPHCGTLNQASTFIFAKKVIQCGNCEQDIDVKSNRLTSRKCPHCKNVFVYDQAKKKHECPACHRSITEGFGKLVSFPCPQCSCIVQVDENTHETTCPVCDHKIENVEKEVAKQKALNDTGVNVLKYEGDNQTFIWKHPLEDFNYGTQLIVHESQEAVFFVNGQALDTFGPGRYSLETESIPMLKKVNPLPTGKQNPFHAEVYFINKTVQMSIPWGTPQKIRIAEPTTGAPVELGAFGEMNLQVSDGRKLLIKLVGTTAGISWENSKECKTSLQNYFRPFITTCFKSNLAAILKAEAIDLLEVDQELERLSAALGKKLSVGFEEYGLTIPQFYINALNLEGDETFESLKQLRTQRLKEKEFEFARKMTAEAGETELLKKQFDIERERMQAQFQAEKDIMQAQVEAEKIKATGFADAEVMKAKGYNQKDVLQADVQIAYAQGIGQMGGNGGGGGTMADVLGLGVGLAAMGTMGEKVGDAMKNFTGGVNGGSAPAANTWTCSCGVENAGKFCSECGKAKPEPWDCPACGATGNMGKFCQECGKAKPEAWVCPACGTKGNTGKFCQECGQKKEEN